jgi:cytidylate kinase
MNVAATFTPSESADVRVVAGQTVLETRLAAWMKKVEESVS